MSNCASKIKLENQVETLQKENIILRRKVDSEHEKFKDTVLSWDKINKDLQEKLSKEQEALDTAKNELHSAQETIRAQRGEIDELLSKVRILTGTGSSAATAEQLMSAANKQTDAILSLGQIELEKKTKELNLKLIESQTEIRSLKQQIEISKGSVEEYKSLCKSMEDQLNSATEGSKNFNVELQERLACKDDIIREVQSKLDAIEKENYQLKEEKEKMIREVEGKSTHLEDELTRMRRELQVANSRLQSSVEESIKVKQDLERQVKMTQEFQAQYEKEMSQNSNQVEMQVCFSFCYAVLMLIFYNSFMTNS
jgi:chromosome segregation ATPase